MKGEQVNEEAVRFALNESHEVARRYLDEIRVLRDRADKLAIAVRVFLKQPGSPTAAMELGYALGEWEMVDHVQVQEVVDGSDR